MPKFTSFWPPSLGCLLRCWSPNLQLIEHPDLVSDGLRVTSLARFESGLQNHLAILNWFMEEFVAATSAQDGKAVRKREDDPRRTYAVEERALNLINAAPDGEPTRLEEVPEDYQRDVGSQSFCALFEIAGPDWETCRNRADALSLAIELAAQAPASFPCYWGERHHEPRRPTWNAPETDLEVRLDRSLFDRICGATEAIHSVIGLGGFNAVRNTSGPLPIALQLRQQLSLARTRNGFLLELVKILDQLVVQEEGDRRINPRTRRPWSDTGLFAARLSVLSLNTVSDRELKDLYRVRSEHAHSLTDREEVERMIHLASRLVDPLLLRVLGSPALCNAYLAYRKSGDLKALRRSLEDGAPSPEWGLS